MPCTDCLNARESTAHCVFDPRCLYCGARYFQRLRTAPPVTVQEGMKERPETQDERKAWMTHVLDVWEKQGHDRARIRELAMVAVIPYEPVTGEATEAPKPKAKRSTSTGRARAAASAGPSAEEAS